MKYGTVAGKRASRIVAGTAYSKLIDGKRDDDTLDQVAALGVNTFDTACHYGRAQAMFGTWLSTRTDRDRLVIESKGCHPLEPSNESRVNKTCLDDDLHRALDELQTDYLDVFLLHRDDPSVPVGAIVDWLNEHYEQGEIRAFGGSNWEPDRLQEANVYASQHGLHPFEISSPNYSLASQMADPHIGHCATLNAGANAASNREWYRTTQMSVFAYSVLGRGFMTGAFCHDERDKALSRLDESGRKGYDFPENYERLRRAEELAHNKKCTVAQIAIAWVFAGGMDVYALLSMTSSARAASSIGALDVELSPSEAAWLNLES